MALKLEHTSNSAFTLSALSKGIRLDGRPLYDFRRLYFKFGQRYGQVEVTLGKTRVFCTLNGEITEPYDDRPNEGFFSIHTHTNIINQFSDNHLINTECVEIGVIIERLLKGCRAIDVESLCILGAKKVWSIRLDLRILSNDGNLRDACSLAALAGVSHFRLPEIELTTNNQVIQIPIDQREPLPLCVHHLPFLVTFVQFNNFDDLLVVDPLYAEEALMDGRISIAINQFGELCGIYKPGGKAFEYDMMSQAIELATRVSKEFMEIFEKAFEEDRLQRLKARKNIHSWYTTPVITVNNIPPKPKTNFQFIRSKRHLEEETHNNSYTHTQTTPLSTIYTTTHPTDNIKMNNHTQQLKQIETENKPLHTHKNFDIHSPPLTNIESEFTHIETALSNSPIFSPTHHNHNHIGSHTHLNYLNFDECIKDQKTKHVMDINIHTDTTDNTHTDSTHTNTHALINYTHTDTHTSINTSNNTHTDTHTLINASNNTHTDTHTSTDTSINTHRDTHTPHNTSTPTTPHPNTEINTQEEEELFEAAIIKRKKKSSRSHR